MKYNQMEYHGIKTAILIVFGVLGRTKSLNLDI